MKWSMWKIIGRRWSDLTGKKNGSVWWYMVGGANKEISVDLYAGVGGMRVFGLSIAWVAVLWIGSGSFGMFVAGSEINGKNMDSQVAVECVAPVLWKFRMFHLFAWLFCAGGCDLVADVRVMCIFGMNLVNYFGCWVRYGVSTFYPLSEQSMRESISVVLHYMTNWCLFMILFLLYIKWAGKWSFIFYWNSCWLVLFWWVCTQAWKYISKDLQVAYIVK